MADFVWEASRGGLNRVDRAEIRDRFAAYFETVRYEVWENLEPPHVAVSGDGTSAWMAVVIEARLEAREASEEEQHVSFESSWISTWQKLAGAWRMTGISSSVIERG